MNDSPLTEGWYLMSTHDLERELARRRGEDVEPTNALPLTIEEALAYKAAGNLPDELGRTLRLVLPVASTSDLEELDATRARFEPDLHEAPTWRGPGSKPINVVPLRAHDVAGPRSGPWWEQPDVAALEGEWRATGTVEGVRVPSEYRSFVYKTVLSLKRAQRPVTLDSVLASIARWVPEDDLGRIASALQQANRAPRDAR